MTDRTDTPVTEDELHAYVDGELPADRRRRRRGVAGQPSRRCRPRRRLARPGRSDPRPLRRRRRTSRCRTGSKLRPDHAHAALLGRGCGRRRGGRGVRGRRRRRLGGARRLGRSARAPSSCSPADALGAHRLYIGEVRHPIEVQGRRGPSAAVAVAPRRHHAARARSRRVRAQAAGRTAVARHRRTGGAVHVRGRQRRALHDLLLASSTRPRSAFRYDATDNFGAVHWVEGGYALGGERAGGQASGSRQIAERGLRAAREPTARRQRSSSNQLISRRGS